MKTASEEKIHTLVIAVRWDEMDSNGHVNNKVYQSYFDESRVQAMTDLGINFPKLREEKIGPIITRIELDYKSEVSHPDSVRIESKLESQNKYRKIFHQNMFRDSDNELVCIAKTFWFFMDFNKKRPVSLI